MFNFSFKWNRYVKTSLKGAMILFINKFSFINLGETPQVAIFRYFKQGRAQIAESPPEGRSWYYTMSITESPHLS